MGGRGACGSSSSHFSVEGKKTGLWPPLKKMADKFKIIIRLLLDDDTVLILDPIMRSVSELSLDEIFGTLMNN